MKRDVKRPLLALGLLAAAIFIIGTSELLPTGLLPEIGREFGVSIRLAGWAVTVYALGVVIGGPLLTVAAARVPHRPLLISTLAVFAIGSFLSFASASYGLLLLSRVICAAAQGAFFGAAVSLAGRLATPGKEGASISLAASGLTVATVLGNPLGTLIGQQAGWRWPFLILAVLALLAAAGIWRAVPRMAQEEASDNMGSQLADVHWPKLLLALLTTVFGTAGTFLVLTYIAPLLENKSGLPGSWLSYVLVLFGAATFIGNYLGGKFADRSLKGTLLGSLIGLIAVMALFAFAVNALWPAILTVFVWGLLAYAIITPLNLLALSMAGPVRNLASSLNISAFNLGNALGAFIGGQIADSALGLGALPWAAALMALIGLGLASRVLANARAPGRESATVGR